MALQGHGRDDVRVDCHEGNYAIEHFLRGARADEQRAPQGNR